MDKIELDMIKGMVSILNEASESCKKGKPIMTDGQYNVRLADLREAEKNTGFVLLNSPTCNVNMKSIVEVKSNFIDNFKQCDNTEDVLDFLNEKEAVAYIDIAGLNMSIAYTDGIVTKIQVENPILNIAKINNIPYKINKKGNYTVKGKVVFSDKLEFIVTNVVKGGVGVVYSDLDDAELLNFDIVPYWIVTNFNSKNIQSNINYMFEYAKEEELPYNGVIFVYNDIEHNKSVKGVKFHG